MSDERPKETSRIVDMNSAVLGRTRLELVGHARMQMKTREIGIGDIIHTIKSPVETDLPTQAGRKRYRWNKTIAQAIDVVFEILPDRLRIITVIAIKRRLIERKK